MKRIAKKYKKALEALQGKTSFASLEEAVKALKSSSMTKFDGTAEIHVSLNVDVKQSDQQIRSTVQLPHGTGKKIRLAAIVTDDKVEAVKKAGADAAGLEDIIDQFAKGKVDYDVILATPQTMKDLSKVAKVLGQKGLMPNPKSGTVTQDIESAVREFKRGKVELRTDKEGNIHSIFGKVSFKEEELLNNLKMLLQTIKDAKPASVKGTFIRSITLCSTMSPGIHLDVNQSMSSLSK